MHRIASLLFTGLLAFDAMSVRAAEAVAEVRLYAIDCGLLQFKDLTPFADTGEYDGKPGNLAAPCFLIRHPKGNLLWDTGLGDKIAAAKDGVDVENGALHLSQKTTLIDQLKSIGVTPADVSYVAFSHFHFDHTGNAGEFTGSTWIVNKAEVATAQQNPPPYGFDPGIAALVAKAKTQPIDGDYDVFGDGSVKILKTPGHTPGHQVLEVKLKKSGVVILSGDLYHTLANRQFRRVPIFNTERADTLASIDRVEKIVTNTHARFVVQHSAEDFARLPKLPAYLN
ncbi:MAG: N-acyl homoserine lactonase family protein [Gammaproteobacteria bacterium]|nr:MAG: N-acyl homoserine lactonase family protein [Gammaproteobacteria bacterium]